MTDQLIPNMILVAIGIIFIGITSYVWMNTPEMELDISLSNFTVPHIVTGEVPTPFEKPDVNDIPTFKTFAEEVNWYSQFKESRSDYPEISDVPHICDPLIRAYKGTTDTDIKIHLSKDILKVCEL